MANQVKITLKRSTIGCTKVQKDTVAALGLKKIGAVKIHNQTDSLKGMIVRVNHLITVEEIA